MAVQLRAPYTTTAFPPGVVPRSGMLEFTDDDLAHAMFATGRAPGDQWSHGLNSLAEWLHRAALIPAYLYREPRTGHVRRSALALELDRSEKVGLSYALGQAMTSLFTRQVLKVPYLMHVDRYAARFAVHFGNTGKRADLFGSRPVHTGDDEWVVAEAKGRSGAMESGLRAALTEQKRSIATIDGRKPVAYGCVASFPGGGGLRVDAFDPDRSEADAIALDADLDRFILAYYEPFVLALDVLAPRRQSGPYAAGGESLLGLRVEVHAEIAHLVRSSAPTPRRGLWRDVQAILGPLRDDLDNPAFDGVVVQAPLSGRAWGPERPQVSE